MMRHYREFTIEIRETKASQEAERLGIPEPEVKRARLSLDLHSVVGFWESPTDTELYTCVECSGDVSFDILIPYADFRRIMEDVGN